MDETKPWYLSRAVWAGVVAAVVGVLTMLGVDLGSESENLVDVILGLVEVTAGIVAIYGRVKAKLPIGGGKR